MKTERSKCASAAFITAVALRRYIGVEDMRQRTLENSHYCVKGCALSQLCFRRCSPP
jgi:hypothetical protein